MGDEPLSLDEETQLILTYVGVNRHRYSIDDSGRLYVRFPRWKDSKLVTPYGTGDPVKYAGICEHKVLHNTLCELLEKQGFDMTRKGNENIFSRALKKDVERFFAATYEVCTGPCVTDVPYEELVSHIDRKKSIVTTNRKLRLGFYTVPIKRHTATDQEISDASAEIFIPEWIRNGNDWP